jgi:hypothetical protein
MLTPEMDERARGILYRMNRAHDRLQKLVPPAATPLEVGVDPEPIPVDMKAWTAASDELDGTNKEWRAFMKELKAHLSKQERA